MSPVNLKIKTESRPNSRMSVELEVPSERLQTSFNEAISRLSRSVKLPGFRKGKVPRAVLIQQIGVLRIQATALETLVDGVWKEAINQESIEPLCEPELKGGFEPLLDSFKTNEPITICLETDVAPTPKLKASKGLQAETERISFDPSKVDELIEQSRKQLATLVPIDSRPAALGDVAVVSFTGTYNDDGSEIEGGKAESMDIDLEVEKMIPGFVEGIVGMNINEQKTLKCQFPNDYPEKAAQGRQANFIVKLKDLKTRELPELDDAFAKQAGEKENMAELRDDLEKRLKEDIELRNRNNRHEALLKVLVQQLEVELPKTLIDQEVRNLVEQTASKFAQQGMDVKSMFTAELVKSLMESSRDEAQENLRRTLALNALAEAENIKITDQEVEAKFKEVKPKLAGDHNIDPNKLRQAINDDLLQDKLLQWLEENNAVVEKANETSAKDIESKKKPKATKNSSKTEKQTKKSPKS